MDLFLRSLLCVLHEQWKEEEEEEGEFGGGIFFFLRNSGVTY